MSCSNQTICYTFPHLSLHVPFFFMLIILTHCYVIVNSFYYPPLQAYLQYKKSFHYITNPSCVGLITALCSLSNSNIVISFLIMLIGTLLYKLKVVEFFSVTILSSCTMILALKHKDHNYPFY